jgi:hypothetical protein
MRPSGPEIAWSRSRAHTLEPAMRAQIGELWSAIMEAEHRSAAIFATFVLDLIGAGAPREIVSVASRAVLDEVRHADLCARLAALYTGHPVEPPAGLPHVPDDPSFTLFQQSVRQALFLSVASETYSAVTLATTHDRARDPVVRAVVGAILADEVHHARLGWSYLRFLLESDRETEVRAFVATHLGSVFDDLARALFGDAENLPPPAYRGRAAVVASEHGYIPIREQHSMFLDALRDIWIPTFRSLGFATTSLDARLGSRAKPSKRRAIDHRGGAS